MKPSIIWRRIPSSQQALGTDFTSYYIQVKTEEWVQYQRSVSEWEIDRYLMTF